MGFRNIQEKLEKFRSNCAAQQGRHYHKAFHWEIMGKMTQKAI